MIKKAKKILLSHKKAIIEEKLPVYMHKSGFLSSMYYTFFSSAFHREHKAVLAGKIAYLNDQQNHFFLVRNIHRLEKGLLMRPRKEIFGLGYIANTVDTFVKICSGRGSFQGNPQYQWFYDVLKAYFRTVTITESLLPIKEKFESHYALTDTCQKRKEPYYREKHEFSKITFDEFYKLTRQRRSVRWFEKKKVPRDLIDKAILAGIQAPSACNRQPFEYKIIDDPSLLKKAVDLPMGTRGYGHSIPAMVVIVGNLNAYFSERDRHLIYIDASLANMALMLALETLGLSSCSINWPDIEEREREMDEFLNLKEHQRAIMCLAVGFADKEGMVAYSEKRNLDNIRSYNYEK